MAAGGIVLFAYEDSFGSAGVIGVLLSLRAAVGAALYKVCTITIYTVYHYYHCVQYILPKMFFFRTDINFYKIKSVMEK